MMKYTLLGKSDTFEKAIKKVTAEEIALCVEEKKAIEFVLKQKLHLI